MNRKTFKIAVRAFPPFESAMEKFWRSFTAETGCDLELEMVPMDLHPLYDALFTREELKNGTWDVAHIVTDWIAEAYDTHSLVDLRSAIDTDPPEEYPQGWSSSLLGQQDFGDALIGLPFHDGPECLIYRTDLFEDPDEQAAFEKRYGRPLTCPATWDEFLDVAHFFHRPEDNLYGTVFAAYPDGHNTVFDFVLQLWTRGGEFLTPEDAVVLNTPEAKRAMVFYRAVLNDPHAVHPHCAEFDSVQSGMAFARGEIAMMVNWFGFAAMCETIADSKVKGKVDIAAIPHDPGSKSASLNVYWLYTVAQGSPHRDTAYRFIRHCIGRKNDKLLTLEGGIGCRLSTWEDPEVNREIPYYHRLSDLHEHARELPRKSNWSKYAGVLDRVVIEVINSDKPVDLIMNEGQEKVNKLQ